MTLDERWWNLVASIYDLQARLETPTLDAAIELAAITPSDHLLDAGCGTGLLTRRLADRGIQPSSITSVDRSPRMLARAPSTTTRVRADLCKLPFPDATFDVIVSTFVLHTLCDSNQTTVIQELARVARPGARIVIACPHPPLRRILRRRIDAHTLSAAWRAINGLTPFDPDPALATAGCTIANHTHVTKGYRTRCTLACTPSPTNPTLIT